MSCPNCESADVTESVETIQFPYGVEPLSVDLPVVVPIMSCGGCGEQWLDWRGEQAKELAVRQHIESLKLS
jgi:hypothetical protein